MKVGVVMVGVILMVLGGMLTSTIFFTPYSIGSTTGITIFPLAGMIMGIVGFLTFLVGLAAPETEKQPRQKTYPPFYKKPPAQQPTQKVRVVAICPRCKNRIPTTVKFCPECGEDLRPQKTS